ncbi:MAG TPA: PDZ domain-containing protein [Candidatus Acidoferrales bacterium]|nr:PDZ domain-containing protein [Candidatus Acidoferrales bacterium]
MQRDLQDLQGKLKIKSKDLEDMVQHLQSEVAAKMAENGMNREELEALTARLEANESGIAQQARTSAEQAQQLFALNSAEDTGWLGIEIGEVSADQAKEFKLPEATGVLVSQVLPNGPAAKAGLQPNDVILQYEGTKVEGTVQFRRLVRETPPGRAVGVTVMRDGREAKLSIQVGNLSDNAETRLREVLPPRMLNFHFEMPEMFPGMTPVLGIEAEDVNGQLGNYFRVPGDSGVLIRSVTPGTPAAKAGLEAGDVITHVDDAPVKTVSDLRDQLRKKRDQKNVSLKIVRQGAEKSVTVSIEPPTVRPAATRSAAL